MRRLSPTVRRALPALLTIWGTALLLFAVLDWAHYSIFLRLFLVAR